MTRLDRVAREIAQWGPIWGWKWAHGYLIAALVAEERERRGTEQ